MKSDKTSSGIRSLGMSEEYNTLNNGANSSAFDAPKKRRCTSIGGRSAEVDLPQMPNLDDTVSTPNCGTSGTISDRKLISFDDRSGQMNCWITLISQQEQFISEKESIFEKLSRTVETIDGQSRDLEAQLKMLKTGNLGLNNKLQVVRNEGMEVEHEIDRLLGSARSPSNPPNGDQQEIDGGSRLGPRIEDIGMQELGAHSIAANQSPVRGTGDIGSERELIIRMQELEATRIRQDIEISTGHHRETRLRQENARLLSEREDLHKAYTELLSKVNIQNTNIDGFTKREQLAPEKPEKQHNHVTTSAVTQEDVHIEIAKVTTERDELASLLQISKAKLEEVQLALEGSQVLLKNSVTAAEESARALEGLKLALAEANTTISTQDAALVEARTDLGLSKRLHDLTKTALSDSTTSLCGARAALKELNRELSEVKQQSIQYTVLAGQWRETCLSERDTKIQFLSRLAAAGDSIREALRLTNESIQAGANPVFAFSGNVGPAIDRFQALIKSEGKN